MISLSSIIMCLIDTFCSIKNYVCSLFLVKFILLFISKISYGKLIEPSNDYMSISYLNSKNLSINKISSLFLLKKNNYYITRENYDVQTRNICNHSQVFVENFKDLNKKNEWLPRQNENDNVNRFFIEINDIVISNTSFICVEYHHAKLRKPINIRLTKEYFVSGNVIFSDIFVCRFLIYEFGKHVVFEDMNYTLVIIDSNVKIFTMTKNQHILLDATGYTVIENGRYVSDKW